MKGLLRKLAVSQRFSENEFNALCNELDILVNALKTGHDCSPFDLRPGLCAIFLYGKSNESAAKEVVDFANSILTGDYSQSWSDNITRLTSGVFADLQISRIGELLEKISEQKSLTNATNSTQLVSSLSDPKLTGLYENKVDELNIDFTVQILPFDLEVLDPRIVRVKPRKANELHRHAHETVFIFLEGEGKVIVDQFENAVKPGDFAFIPRWCNHQSVNTGETDLVFLAVADFGLTGKSFVGNYLKTARMKSV